MVKNINADNITSGTIDANTITIKNINANNITSGTIDAGTITVENINADNITSGTIDAGRVVGGTLSGCSINIGNAFYVNSSGLVSVKANQLRVYATENVGTYGIGYHYGQTFDMYVVCNTFLGLSTSGINLVFVSGICCGYYA